MDNQEKQENSFTKAVDRFFKHEWFVVLAPFIFLCVIVALLTLTKDRPTDHDPLALAAEQLTEAATEGNAEGSIGGSLEAATGELAIESVLLPEPGIIQVGVVNGSDEAVTIPQLMVDDAYWAFTVEPSTTITVSGVATFTIPYPWVVDERHVVRLITSRGATVDGEVVGGETPLLSEAQPLRDGQ